MLLYVGAGRVELRTFGCMCCLLFSAGCFCEVLRRFCMSELTWGPALRFFVFAGVSCWGVDPWSSRGKQLGKACWLTAAAGQKQGSAAVMYMWTAMQRLEHQCARLAHPL